jgi:ABC-type multidrug transport system ATPase subunit
MLFSISASDIGKKFGTEWIFRGFSHNFAPNQVYVFVGNNGSGKSTLLKTLSGMLSPTQGKVVYTKGKRLLPVEYWFRNIGYAAPYMELVEEFSLLESIEFHAQFKKLLIPNQQIVEELAFSKTATQKPLKFFSSGMKQKLKLALALYTDSKVLCLDEPTANFDKHNLLWYQEQVHKYKTNRIVFLASNLVEEYEFLESTIIEMAHYKGIK